MPRWGNGSGVFERLWYWPWKAFWNSKNWLEDGQEYFLDKAVAEKIAALRTLDIASYEEAEAKQAPRQLSEHKCPDCGRPLRHVVKEGEGGYNFWGCSGFKDEEKPCESVFHDDGGKPGEKKEAKAAPPPSEFKCLKCENPLDRRQGGSQKIEKVGVTDGDMIKVRLQGQGEQIRIRLYGIDAPEKSSLAVEIQHNF